MAGAPRVTPTEQDKKNIPSTETMQAHEAEHASYQTALLRHMTLHRAWASNRFNDDMAVLYERAQATLPRAKAQSPEHVTAAMVEQAFVNPEERFPDIAAAITREVKHQEISHLLELLDHDKNAKLGPLSPNSKEALLAIARDPHVRLSLQFDMMHERTFGPSSTDEGGVLRARIEGWIDQGMSNDISKCIRRGIQTPLPLVGLAGGPAAIAGMGLALAVTKTMPFIAELARKGVKGASQYAGERLSLTADQILAIPEKLGQWCDKGRLRENAKGAVNYFAVAGSVCLLGYATNSPDQMPGLGAFLMDAFGHLKDLDLSIWDQASTAAEATQETDTTTAADRIDKARKAQQALVGFVMTGLVGANPSKFNHEQAGSFFKANPTHLGAPTLDTAAVDDIGHALAPEPAVKDASEATLADWHQWIAQQPASPDYAQAMALLEAALIRIDAGPQQAQEILATVSPWLPDACERVADGHRALLDRNDITRLARKDKHAARLLTEMATPGDVQKIFLVAAGQCRGQDGIWRKDERLGAGRHRARVACLLGEVAQITCENVPEHQLERATPAETPSRQRQEDTMVTPGHGARPFSPST